jgi:hypothetical protein
VAARKTRCKRDHEFTPENTRITARGARGTLALESNGIEPSGMGVAL